LFGVLERDRHRSGRIGGRGLRRFRQSVVGAGSIPGASRRSFAAAAAGTRGGRTHSFVRRSGGAADAHSAAAVASHGAAAGRQPTGKTRGAWWAAAIHGAVTARDTSRSAFVSGSLSPTTHGSADGASGSASGLTACFTGRAAAPVARGLPRSTGGTDAAAGRATAIVDSAFTAATTGAGSSGSAADGGEACGTCIRTPRPGSPTGASGSRAEASPATLPSGSAS
jgi:hypothetical protein